MNRLLVAACLVATGLIAPTLAAAQDVAITNARVIVGSATAAQRAMAENYVGLPL